MSACVSTVIQGFFAEKVDRQRISIRQVLGTRINLISDLLASLHRYSCSLSAALSAARGSNTQLLESRDSAFPSTVITLVRLRFLRRDHAQ